MKIPLRTLMAMPPKARPEPGRPASARAVTPAIDSLAERPVAPIDSAPAIHYPSQQPHQQGNFADSNLLQSNKVRDRQTYQRLIGSYEKNLAGAAQALRKSIRANSTTASGLLSLVGGDANQAVETLKAAAEQAHSDGDKDEHILLLQLAQHLRRTQRTTVRESASTRSPNSSNRSGSVRQMYSTAATNIRSVTKAIETLLDQQEAPDQFSTKLQQMHNLITDDLAALAPAASQKQIRAVVHGINNLRHVAILLRGCTHVVGRMRGKNPSLKIDPVNFLQELLRLSATGMQIEQTQQFAEDIGGTELKHQLSFLNALRPMLQELPILLWQDLDKRRIALGNLRELMTRLTESELNQGMLA